MWALRSLLAIALSPNNSLIIVPLDAKDITTQKIKKIGTHSSHTA